MPSKTDIANRALLKLGDLRVSNIETDNSPRAIILNDIYDSVRDELLSYFPWVFAKELAKIAVDASSPDWGYGSKYLLPTDFLRLIEIRGNPNYSLLGKYLHTDAGSPLYIKYIKRIENAGDFSTLFAEAFACKLAVEACEKISSSNTKKQILTREFYDTISKAYVVESIQEEPDTLLESSWIVARG